MPTSAQIDRQQAIAAIDAELGYHLQAAGLKVVPGDAFETPAQYRAAQIRRLQEALPKDVHGALRGRMSPSLYELAPDVTGKIERHVLNETMRAAHESPDMRTVIVRDRSGREITEFVGGRMGWMNQFKQQPRLMVSLGDAKF